MKETLINEKEQAYLSKTRNHRYQCAYWIGLDDHPFGSSSKNLAKFYEEISSLTRQALILVEKKRPCIDYTESSKSLQICSRKIVSSILRFLGTITIRNPSSVSHGDRVSSTRVLQILVFYKHRFSKNFSKNAPKGLWLQGPRSCSATALLPSKSRVWQSITSILSTVRTMRFQSIASLYSQIALPLDEVVTARESQKAIPEKAVLYLARKVVVLLDTEEPM